MTVRDDETDPRDETDRWDETDPPDNSAERDAATYERGLAQDSGRRGRGAFYTPPALVGWILDRALAPTGPTPTGPGRSGRSGSLRVLDPACGTGHFLVEAARRLGDVRAVWGSDTDAEAVRLARRRLADLDPRVPMADLESQIRIGDGLGQWVGGGFDAVVGNPPFLGQLRRRTAGQTGGLGAYTDTSAAFLHAALQAVRDGGVVALVQPLSVLAARDAGPVRSAVAEQGAVLDFWCSREPVFEGTSVLTCVPVVRRGARPGTDPDGWGRLAAATFGIPDHPLAVPTDPTAGSGRRARRAVGDVAEVTADFRDQYYGLRPYVQDAPSETRASGGPLRRSSRWAPLVTTGLIEPAQCRWGEVSTRFARRRYDAPLVDLAALDAGPDRALARWAHTRRVPKLLVAAQGRVVEAVVDVEGGWLPSVPVLTVTPRSTGAGEADLWRLLAVTLAPPVVATAATLYLGTGLSPQSVKVSARQLAALPLPPNDPAWAAGAEAARTAQRASTPAERVRALDACATEMTKAYGLAPSGDGAAVLDWWRRRAHRGPAPVDRPLAD